MFTKALIVLVSLAVVSFASSNNRHFGGVGRPSVGFRPSAGLGGGFGNVNSGFGHGVGAGVGVGVGGGFGGVGASSSGSCRYWCRTPKGQAYCCEGGNEPVALPSVKPGQCPPVRPQCPPVRNFRPPTTCSNDSKCPGAEKCCYDTCLEHHTCKLPLSYY